MAGPFEFSIHHRISQIESQRLAITIQETQQTVSKSPTGRPTLSTGAQKTANLECSDHRIFFQTTAWTVLYRLTSPGRISFETAASLRSGKFHDWELYAFFRLAGHFRRTVTITGSSRNEASLHFSKSDEADSEFT